MSRVRIKLARSGALLAAVALLGAACAAPPEEEVIEQSPDQAGTETESDPAAASDFLPCMVSGTGGFSDKSFNQSAYEGMQRVSEDLGLDAITVESRQETDYGPNMTQLVNQGCDLIIAVGYPLADAVNTEATADPGTNFAIIDDDTIDLPNVKPILFQTSQAAFLAGYAAADYSETGVVGTYGGMQIPSVTIFMDGFADGVDYFNESTGADVTVLGWDKDTQQGTFTGGFAAGVESKAAAQGLIDQNADVIMPVGGPIFTSAAEAIRDSGLPVAMVGVDSDVYLLSPENADLFLTSIMKSIDQATFDVVTASAEGGFSADPYVGTLDNDGVGLAPFHDFEDRVAPDLHERLDEIKQMIIDGEIVVESPSNIVQ